VTLLRTLVVTSIQLWNAYHANSVKADQQYLNKRFSITGKVIDIAATYTAYLEGGPGAITGVTVSYADGELPRAATVRPWHTITLNCRGAGIVFGEPLVVDCRFP
jgi:hypothetical protein